jgi:hypothetical protein
MEQYHKINSKIKNEHEIDPVTMENFNSYTHPRGTIMIRRSNNIPFPILTTTAYDIINKGDGKDPVTRVPFSELTKKRIQLYVEAIKEFPDVKEINIVKTYEKWQRLIYTPETFSKKDAYLAHLEARVFLQADDLLDIFHSFYGKGSTLNRLEAEKYLKENPERKWILRNCSIKDSLYDKAYAISVINPKGNVLHWIIIHKIGEGFAIPKQARSGDHANKINCVCSYPTIIDILETM